jgi:arylsulfatase A-like enzyme
LSFHLTFYKAYLFFGIILVSFCRPEPTVVPSEQLRTRPNVLWVVIDSLRGDIVGRYGVTPELDRFTKASYVFTNHLVNAAWTRPSTLVFFTGKYASRNPVNFWDYPTPKSEARAFYEKEPFPLPKYLSQNGIHTVMVGNNPFLTDKNGLGVDVGFQEQYDYSNYGSDTPLITKKSLQVLSELTDSSNNQKPFFFFLNFNDPHKPYTPPSGYTDLIRTSEVLEEKKRDYLGEVGYIDDQLRVIFDQMKMSGIWENTIIIVTADHGEVMQLEHSISPFTGTNTYFGHGQDLFLENIHVPLLIKEANQKTGKRIEAQTQSVDLYPFVLDAFGLPAMSKLDGVGLRKAMDGQKDPNRFYYGETRSTQGIGQGSEFLLQKSFRFHELGKFWEGYVGREIFFYYDTKTDPLQILPIRFSEVSELSSFDIASSKKERIKFFVKELRKLEPPLPVYTVRFSQKGTTKRTLEARISVSSGQIRIKSKSASETLNIRAEARSLVLKVDSNSINAPETLEISFEVYPDVYFPNFQFFEDGVDVTGESVGVGMFDLSLNGCASECVALFESPFGKPTISAFNHFQVWQSGGTNKSYVRDTSLETDAMEILRKQGYVQ